jgi:hypothetical protein
MFLVIGRLAYRTEPAAPPDPGLIAASHHDPNGPIPIQPLPPPRV